MSEIIPGIFKAYDVRGLYPGEIHEMVAHEIGGAYVTYLNAKRIGVSRDMRVSSPALMDAFVAGARGQGCDVVDYGMQATDMIYFAVVRDGLDGGVQITASHNPKQYNGIKMVRKGAQPLSGDEGIGEIRDMVVAKATPPKAPRAGALTQANVLDDYTKKVMGFIDKSLIKPFNVVLDAANGMAGLVAPKLFDQLPCKTTRLAFTPDGTFPNYEANPLIEENRKVVTERVLREKADIGIAWDGDADRVFFIDGNGEFIAGDFITALLAEAFLIRQPGQADRLRRACQLRRQGHRREVQRLGPHEPRRPRLLQGPHARDQLGLRRRGHRALLLPRLLLLRQRVHPGAADPRADVAQEPDAGAAARAAAAEVLHLRRDQHPRRRHVAVQGQDRRARREVHRMATST